MPESNVLMSPKSIRKERMQQNFDTLDFTLSEDDMQQIAEMNLTDSGNINFRDPQFVNYILNYKV